MGRTFTHLDWSGRCLLTAMLCLGFILAAGIPAQAQVETGTSAAPRISGKIISGLRVIPLSRAEAPFELTVYRGDYIIFMLSGYQPDALLTIPRLNIRQILGADVRPPPYFKMKTPGVFTFTLAETQGRIRVLDYHHRSYHEVSAAQAAELISRNTPLILDVRTPREFKKGHLADAKLLPVQELQQRVGELSGYKDQDILIYCATGNRSTVASKILADQGFTKIYNLHGGIREWLLDKRPLAGQ